jgi:hypothetical protein
MHATAAWCDRPDSEAPVCVHGRRETTHEDARLVAKNSRMAATTKLVAQQACWWDDEVSALRATAATLTPATRTMVRSVLSSLLEDAATDADARSEIEMLLAVLGRPALAKRSSGSTRRKAYPARPRIQLHLGVR